MTKRGSLGDYTQSWRDKGDYKWVSDRTIGWYLGLPTIPGLPVMDGRSIFLPKDLVISKLTWLSGELREAKSIVRVWSLCGIFSSSFKTLTELKGILITIIGTVLRRMNDIPNPDPIKILYRMESDIEDIGVDSESLKVPQRTFKINYCIDRLLSFLEEQRWY